MTISARYCNTLLKTLLSVVLLLSFSCSQNQSDTDVDDDLLCDADIIDIDIDIDIDNIEHDNEISDEDTLDDTSECQKQLELSDKTYKKCRLEWKFIKSEEEYAADFSLGSEHNALLTFQDALYLFSGGVSQPAVYRSEDGILWKKLETKTLPAFSGIGTITLHTEEIVAYTPEGFFSSRDGVTWELLNNQVVLRNRTGAKLTSWQGQLWLLGGYDSSIVGAQIWTSNDGVIWNLFRTYNHEIWEETVITDGMPSWEFTCNGNGVQALSFINTPDFLLLFGGHYSSEENLDRWRCTGGFYHYASQAYLLSKDWNTTLKGEFVDFNYNEVSGATTFRYGGRLWITAGTQVASDKVLERYGRPYSTFSCKEQPLFHRPQVLKFSSSTIQTSPNDTTLPLTVRNYPLIAGFGDEVFILGAEGSSEIWSATERLFATDNKTEFLCSKGLYEESESMEIASNADAEKFRGFTRGPALIISGEVDDLSPLFCLSHVKRLRIKTQSSSLDGLEALEHIDEGLYMSFTPLLSLSLPNLRSVGTTIAIEYNYDLRNITMESLSELPERVIISYNDHLEKITFSDEMTSSSLRYLVFEMTDAKYTSFSALKNVKTLETLKMNNDFLDPLTFSSLERVETLNIWNSTPKTFPHLTQASTVLLQNTSCSFPSLQTVEDELRLRDIAFPNDSSLFPSLEKARTMFLEVDSEDIPDFNALKECEELTISAEGSPSKLTKISGFSNPNLQITQSFGIWDTAIVTLDSVSLLTSSLAISFSKLNLYDNNKLIDISALNGHIPHISGWLRVTNSPLLTDISVLKTVTSITEESSLSIRGERIPTCHAEEIAEHFRALGMDEEKIFISGTDDEATCE